MGMYGFDSKMNCHVSMPSLAVTLVNLDCKRIIGEITTLSLPNRSTVDYWLNPLTRWVDETSRRWRFLIPA